MKNGDRHIIIFDGVCNLCEYSVQFILKNDRNGRFRFVAAQSERGKSLQLQCGVDTMAEGTVILLKNAQVYTKSDAALEIARELDAPWKYLRIFKLLPKPMRDYLYSIVAKNRYRWFGRKNECLIPDEHIKHKFL